MNNSNQSKLTLIPVMIAFFTMGFVDLVGAVSNNMQEDFGLSRTPLQTSSPRSCSSGSLSSLCLRACS